MRFGYVPVRAKNYFLSKNLFDFSGRLIMPLFDPYGSLVVITTRDLRPQAVEDKTAHLHETFDKRHYLYGLDTAKKHMIAKKSVIVVEGQFDVGYLRTVGFRNTVGMLGTALSHRQASLLARYCDDVYLLFDGDNAGRQATRKSMELYRNAGLRLTGLTFIPVDTPEGKDPDDLSADEVTSLCENAKVMSEILG
jgi:DNA primase